MNSCFGHITNPSCTSSQVEIITVLKHSASNNCIKRVNGWGAPRTMSAQLSSDLGAQVLLALEDLKWPYILETRSTVRDTTPRCGGFQSPHFAYVVMSPVYFTFATILWGRGWTSSSVGLTCHLCQMSGDSHLSQTFTLSGCLLSPLGSRGGMTSRV